MTRKVGIKDVAEAAGVSITTVSHALNDKGRLPDQTRQLVRDTARRLGYRPNLNARSLAGGRTGILALAVSQAEGMAFQLGDFDYFAQLISSTTTAALDRGYTLLVAPAVDTEDALASVPNDGAIVVDPVRDDRTVAYLRGRDTPVVTTGRVPGSDDGACWVDNDHVAGVREALDHLAGVGADRIALVAPPPFASYVEDVRRGYSQWCVDNGRDEIVATADNVTEVGGFVAATELLERPDPPDAIYAALDRLALGVLLAADARGVVVPRDLLVAGCTDSHAARTARPPLTALNLDPEAIGDAAVEMLIELVEGRELEQRHRTIPTTIVPRASTLGKPPTATG